MVMVSFRLRLGSVLWLGSVLVYISYLQSRQLHRLQQLRQMSLTAYFGGYTWAQWCRNVRNRCGSWEYRHQYNLSSCRTSTVDHRCEASWLPVMTSDHYTQFRWCTSAVVFP